MTVTLTVLRQASPDDAPYRQTILFETDDMQMTVASMLQKINADPACTDTEGRAVTPIRWECSCLQKKCGACAMRINGRPRLACDALLSEFRRGRILLEPLRKFPVVADLTVDRSILMQNLMRMQIWFAEDAEPDEAVRGLTYDASRCLQCGCCLEVCPNFCADGKFYGMAGLLPAARLLTALPESQKEAMQQAYRKHLYEGCGKSLACHDICPAGIPVDRLLVNANAAAVWKRRPRRRREKPDE
ncbi:MAG: succinate dehydrogenase [Oscillospiraceae bacterium]|nr:succinate dehydrogenase [Oscillospiraceae bacterium]